MALRDKVTRTPAELCAVARGTTAGVPHDWRITRYNHGVHPLSQTHTVV